MDPEIAPDAGPISKDYRLEYAYQPGAVITPRQGIVTLSLAPVLSKHRLHILWQVAGAVGDEYRFEAELVLMRNRVPVLRLPLETHLRTATAAATVLFNWAAGVAGPTVAENACQCQWTDPVSGLTQTSCVPAFEFDAEADGLVMNVLKNETIAGTGVSSFWFSLLLFSRKP